MTAEMIVLVMREIRLPRALLALLIGASLGLSGAALQGYLRNPLAEPGLLGVSASASFGAVIAIYSGLSLLRWPCRCLRWRGFYSIVFSSSFWRAECRYAHRHSGRCRR